jgi:hypothetical protein
MKSSRQIEKIVGRARAMAGHITDERILTDAGKALTRSTHNRPQAVRPVSTFWRIIMESKVTKYSAAAVVALAATLVLLNPFGTSKNGGIVWAEVVNKVHKMPTTIHKEKCVFWEIGKEKPILEADVITYASDEHGWVEYVFDEKGTLLAHVYFLKETHQFIIMLPIDKKYMKLSLPEDWLHRMTGILTPYGLVDFFTSDHYTKLGRSKFDNFDVEGFEITENTHPNPLPVPEPLKLVFPAKDMVARLWIDVDTSLPVGFEVEFNTDRGLFTGFKKLHCKFKAFDIQWNAELPEGIFEPNIPGDYTEFKVTDFISPEAKAGLLGIGLIPVGFVIWKSRKKSTLHLN